MSESELKTIAAQALACLDLTNLKDDCTEAQIEQLCQRAMTRFGPTAAICIWPRFVAQARALLPKGGPIRIATVVNFPAGTGSIEATVAETEKAIAEGADEIDLVIPYAALVAGDGEAVTTMVQAVKAAIPAPARLKTILETGEIGDPVLIELAARLAVEAGADFIKTSTGKVKVNATPQAAGIMLRVIRDHGGTVGFKPAGGISTVSDAGDYLALAAEILGEGWPTPERFRFGASGLLDDIERVLAGGASASTGSGY